MMVDTDFALQTQTRRHEDIQTQTSRINTARQVGNVDHLEYMAAKKSWIAGRTAEGGQSVIKSVANFTTFKQTFKSRER